MTDSGKSRQRTSVTKVSGITRRKVLQTTGASIAGIGLAGCLGDVTGGDDGSVQIGGTVPLSGPYGYIGVAQKQGIDLAVDHAQEEGDAGDREIQVNHKDTATDVSTGRKRANEHIQDGVDFMAGALSSGVALAISDLAQREDVLYQGLAGSNAATGEDCKSNTFITSFSATMMTRGGLGYPMKEGLGSSVYEISADYEWGQSIKEYNENVLVPEYDGDYLGNTYLPLGTSDFSAALTEAENSGADIININFAHGDFVTAANQLGEFGVLDDHIVTFPVLGIGVAEQVSWDVISHDNFFGGMAYYWNLNDASRSFADPYYEKYGDRPSGGSLASHMYVAVRTTLKAIDEVGSKDVDDLVGALEGREMFPQLWDTSERYRACDHRGVIPTLTGQGRDVDSHPEDYDYFDILSVPENPEETQMRPCDETGCDGPFA